MPEVPRPRHPPRHCPHPQPLGLGLALRRQVGPPITAAQVLAVDKRLAALDHRQVDDALADHFHYAERLIQSKEMLSGEQSIYLLLVNT